MLDNYLYVVIVNSYLGIKMSSRLSKYYQKKGTLILLGELLIIWVSLWQTYANSPLAFGMNRNVKLKQQLIGEANLNSLLALMGDGRFYALIILPIFLSALLRTLIPWRSNIVTRVSVRQKGKLNDKALLNISAKQACLLCLVSLGVILTGFMPHVPWNNIALGVIGLLGLTCIVYFYFWGQLALLINVFASSWMGTIVLAYGASAISYFCFKRIDIAWTPTRVFDEVLTLLQMQSVKAGWQLTMNSVLQIIYLNVITLIFIVVVKIVGQEVQQRVDVEH